jgi:hypothetical protein
MKAIIVVKNKWTDKEYAHPVIYTSKDELIKAQASWDLTHVKIEAKYLHENPPKDGDQR